MADRASITPELCRQLLRYEPETGKLYWLERDDNPAWTRQWAGREAFTANHTEGYKVGRVHNVLFRAHRVIWAMTYDEWPVIVDHINGDKSDNRIENLRRVTNQVNQRNVMRTVNNTSGVTGVYWNRVFGKWQAQIGVDGKMVCLGRFSDMEKAVAARRRAEREIGFGPIHGRT